MTEDRNISIELAGNGMQVFSSVKTNSPPLNLPQHITTYTSPLISPKSLCTLVETILLITTAAERPANLLQPSGTLISLYTFHINGS